MTTQDMLRIAMKQSAEDIGCTTDSFLSYWRNPNLKPIGKGFGFLVFIDQIAALN